MQVRISKPVKSNMQSGDGKQKWILEFCSKDIFIEPFMGRTASKNMDSEIKIEFDSKEDAINFASKKNYSYELIEPKTPKMIKKTYANNFR